MRGEDKFGIIHACYYQTNEQSEPAKDQKYEKQKKKGKKKSKKQPTEDDFPF